MTTYEIDYTASLIGNIRSHLASLKGFDVMALELIQNADDSGAESIEFDVGYKENKHVFLDCLSCVGVSCLAISGIFTGRSAGIFLNCP